ncbi:MAG: efflux RND transporter permease subunit [Pseudomonadota bacterium]
MKHTQLALRRPITVSMICAAFAVLGVMSAFLMPLEEFPNIELPGFLVVIPYPGSTPEETERLVTRPAEEALATLSGIKHMMSRSSADQTEMWLEYGFNSNSRVEAVEARVKLDAIRNNLPDEVKRILVFSGSINDEPIMTLRVSSERDLGNEYLLLNRVVKRRLERLDGVASVELQGVEPPEVLIKLDPGRVAAHNVNLNDLALRLERSNFAVSAGQLTDGDKRYTVRPDGEFADLDEIRTLVINDRGLRLGDIANVSTQPRSRNYGRHLDGEYAIGLAIKKSAGANMVEVADRVSAEITEIGKLPAMRGIQIFDLDNNAASVRQSLNDLTKAGILGAIFAVIVLYLFLRQVTSTLIVTLAVPFSLLITLCVLYFNGFTLNILTLVGLMLAIGMLVDNSVVVTESIYRARQKDPTNPEQATLRGVREVGLAVTASTFTSICVFLPMVFGEQIEVVVFLRHVGVTISVAIVSSLIIAQTLIPLLTSRLPPPKPEAEGAWMRRLTDAYLRVLRGALRRPIVTTISGLLIAASVVIPIKAEWLKLDMFPQDVARRIYMPYNLDGRYPVATVEDSVDRIEAYLFENRERLEIRSVYSYFSEDEAATTVLLVDEDQATISGREVMEIIEREMPSIAIGKPNFRWEQQGGGEGFSVTLRGASTEVLGVLGREAQRRLDKLDGLDSVNIDHSAGEREIRVRVDRERAAVYGLTADDVANYVNAAMRGRDLREFRTPDGEIGMRLGFRDSERQTVQQLGDMRIMAADGRSIPLSSIVNLHVKRGPAEIRRIDRNTAVRVSASVNASTTLDEIRPQIKVVMDELDLPSGYSWGFGSGVERADQTQQVLVQNILLGVALIFIVMAALFESLSYPLTIILSLIYSIVGVIWFLSLTGTTMTMMAMVGIMILIGVVVNNGIVLVDQINNLRWQGHGRLDAVVNAASERFRPILMTVATTILGLVPLAVGTTQIGGSDGPAYFPMARAIIGGLAFSTLTSLILVPFTYIAFDKLKNWMAKMRRYGGPVDHTPREDTLPELT